MVIFKLSILQWNQREFFRMVTLLVSSSSHTDNEGNKKIKKHHLISKQKLWTCSKLFARSLCHHHTTDTVKLDCNVIVGLISKIICSLMVNCDFDFVGNTHEEFHSGVRRLTWYLASSEEMVTGMTFPLTSAYKFTFWDKSSSQCYCLEWITVFNHGSLFYSFLN